MPTLHRIGDFSLQWGESVRWDDRRQRLYFVDCAARSLHWLEGAQPPLRSLELPTMPAGVVLCEDGRLVAALDDGLHLVDPDKGVTELLARYPEELGGRANDASADFDGNLVTGTLNIGPGPGSCWRFSGSEGWRHLADGISNTNGPLVIRDSGDRLIVADTPASAIYAWAYDGVSGTATDRRLLADTGELSGMPDGACVDDDDGVWSCLLGAGVIVRYDESGPGTTIDTTVELPSDVTFGGADLDKLYFVSIALPVAGIEIRSPNAGALMVMEDPGHRGRAEPRFRL